MYQPEQHVILPDRRVLAYSSHGPGSGYPVLYFHGTPASKHNWYLGHDAHLLEELDLRVLALDRPGLGGSSPHGGRDLLDWADDVEAFADALGLDRFALVGYSGGAPFAFAVALRLPERVSQTTIVSGMTDMSDQSSAAHPPGPNSAVLRLGATVPFASRMFYRLLGSAARYLPGPFMRQFLAALPESDRAVALQPRVQADFLTMMHETFAQGPAGAQRDSAIVASPWPFELGAIAGPTRLWHGADDRNVPVGMLDALTAQLPHAQLVVSPGEGHLSLVHREIRRILSALASDVRAG
jgi:pimeloyl-ACP methyl ester carboxylesterase